MQTRRDFHKLAVGALASAGVLMAKPNSVVRGVQIGAQSYSFRTMPLDDAIKAMAAIGLSECELYGGHVEPAGLDRAALRKPGFHRLHRRDGLRRRGIFGNHA